MMNDCRYFNPDNGGCQSEKYKELICPFVDNCGECKFYVFVKTAEDIADEIYHLKKEK